MIKVTFIPNGETEIFKDIDDMVFCLTDFFSDEEIKEILENRSPEYKTEFFLKGE